MEVAPRYKLLEPVNTVYTIQTALLCLNSRMYTYTYTYTIYILYIYILFRMLLELAIELLSKMLGEWASGVDGWIVNTSKTDMTTNVVYYY